MTTMNVYDAKARLSQLCTEAASGQDVIIAKNGKPWVKIVPLTPKKQPIIFGLMEGEIEMADDFDAEDPEITRLFEGDEELVRK